MEIVNDISLLYIEEQAWINASDCCNKEVGYNIKPMAKSSLDYKHTDEARKKLSERNIKNGIVPPSPKGRKWSDETRRKSIIAMTGVKKSSTVNMRGKPKSEEHKRKLSIAKTGKKLSEEHKNKIGQSGKEPDKWPCADGNKCKCNHCRTKRNAYYRSRYLQRK